MTSQQQEEQIAYALITPYSLHKSRTGGILARLLWANVKLVAARMYAPEPDSGFIEDYCDSIYDPEEKQISLHYQRMLIEYIIRNFSRPNVRGVSNRLTLFVFRGPDAQREIAQAVGHLTQDVQGDSVRGTYGDFFREDLGQMGESPALEGGKKLLKKYEELVRVEAPQVANDFFEPAVLTAATPDMNEVHLKLFRKYAYSDGGLVDHAVEGLDDPDTETSLVILKPESFRNRNPLPGNLIDFFARTGLFITAMKVMELDVADAQEFYALKVAQFREQLKGMVTDRARDMVRTARVLAKEAVQHLGADPAKAFDLSNALSVAEKVERLFRVGSGPGEVKPEVAMRIYQELRKRGGNLQPPSSVFEEIAEDLKDLNAQAEFNELIRYMTGHDPTTGRALHQGEETNCMALLYSGPNALSVIRKRQKELRAVYGQNILKNRAHASDPEEDPLREMQVLGMPTAPEGESRPCDAERIVNEFYGPPETAN